jgi:hypothetical protein
MPRIRIKWMKSDKAWGYANTAKNTIYLDHRMADKELLRYALHETEHVLHPEFHEDVVDSDSATMADVLWRLGFRLKEDD